MKLRMVQTLFARAIFARMSVLALLTDRPLHRVKPKDRGAFAISESDASGRLHWPIGRLAAAQPQSTRCPTAPAMLSMDSARRFAYKAAILLIVDDLDDRPGRPVGA
jgi:hypothetical protein